MSVPSRSSRLLVAVLAAVPWLMLGTQWFLVLPRFARLFDQFGLQLPLLPHLLMVLVRLAGEYFLIVGWFFLMGVMLSVTGVFRLMRQDLPAKTRNLLLSLVFALPVAVFLLSWVGVAGPYSKLMEGLGR
jgi:type II secretory pathway component PulF